MQVKAVAKLIEIEYEVYENKSNAALLVDYNKAYRFKIGIPRLIAGSSPDKTLSGDKTIINGLDTFIKTNQGNLVVLPKNINSFK